jgi:alkylation response protein AidB-like acyl-CoA dehydrogenase
MDFGLGEKAEAFRLEARAFIAEHVDDGLRERAWRTGTLHDWDLHRAMAERRWLAPHWPSEYGGDDRDVFELVAMEEEFRNARVPLDGRATTMIAADTIRHVGTEAMKRRVIPSVLSGETLICLGYSEPGSGSDVAAATTRAVRDGDDWIVNGQKMFTTIAHISSYIFLLTRTNSDVPKHRGLTMFLVPMDSPGIEVRPIDTLGGQLVNATYLTDVRVPDEARVGEVDGGWQVMTVGLALERNGSEGIGPTLRAVVDWAARTRLADGRRALDHGPLRAAINAEVCKLLWYRSAWISASGGIPGFEGSMSKLFGSETYNSDAAGLLDAIGPAGILQAGADDAVGGGALERAFRYAPFTAIAGGVNEIQRSIIAERHLGLPKSR